jgi:uncharacterized membrane protein YdfJ with MMPL/SSD domain
MTPRKGEPRTEPRYAIRRGLACGSRVIVAAALIMISVFGSFVLEGRTDGDAVRRRSPGGRGASGGMCTRV